MQDWRFKPQRISEKVRQTVLVHHGIPAAETSHLAEARQHASGGSFRGPPTLTPGSQYQGVGSRTRFPKRSFTTTATTTFSYAKLRRIPFGNSLPTGHRPLLAKARPSVCLFFF